MIRRLFVAALVLAMPVMAAAAIEIIELRHRPADELLPILRPVTPERAAVTGDGYRLIVRGSRAEIEEVRTAVQRLDAGSRSLRIDVRRHAGRTAAADGMEGSGRIRADDDGNDVSGRVRAYSSRDHDSGGAHQSVRALEGRPAFIDTGRGVPVRERVPGRGDDGTPPRESVRFRDAPDGFYATARVRGERVLIEVAVQSDTRRGGDAIASERREVLTTVEGRLGEWLPLAGVHRSRSSRSRGIAHRTRGEKSRFESLEIRVRALD